LRVTKRFKREISAGGLVYRPAGGGGVEVALGRRTGQAGKNVWCLPKGWLEPGEDARAAAQREVREETGLTAEVEEKLGTVKYTYHNAAEGVDVFKIVTFFLLRYVAGDTAGHDFELEEVAWVPLAEAPRRLSYSTEKKMARQAAELLGERGLLERGGQDGG
jgi:8-oxo-dGTP pyrophosphatase MutT (NUDIX family)